MRYVRSKASEQAFLKEDRYVSSWEVAEKDYQKKLKRKKKRRKNSKK